MFPTNAQVDLVDEAELWKFKKQLDSYCMDNLSCFCQKCNAIRTLAGIANLRLKFEFGRKLV